MPKIKDTEIYGAYVSVKEPNDEYKEITVCAEDITEAEWRNMDLLRLITKDGTDYEDGIFFCDRCQCAFFGIRVWSRKIPNLNW